MVLNCKNYTDHVIALCESYSEFWAFNLVLSPVTTTLKRFKGYNTDFRGSGKGEISENRSSCFPIRCFSFHDLPNKILILEIAICHSLDELELTCDDV
jgi:hypothetical protein